MSTTSATAGPVASPLDDLADEALLTAFEGDGLPPGSFAPQPQPTSIPS